MMQRGIHSTSDRYHLHIQPFNTRHSVNEGEKVEQKKKEQVDSCGPQYDYSGSVFSYVTNVGDSISTAILTP